MCFLRPLVAIRSGTVRCADRHQTHWSRLACLSQIVTGSGLRAVRVQAQAQGYGYKKSNHNAAPAAAKTTVTIKSTRLVFRLDARARDGSPGGPCSFEENVYVTRPNHSDSDFVCEKRRWKHSTGNDSHSQLWCACERVCVWSVVCGVWVRVAWNLGSYHFLHPSNLLVSLSLFFYWTT